MVLQFECGAEEQTVDHVVLYPIHQPLMECLA